MVKDYLSAIFNVWISKFGGGASVMLAVLGVLVFGNNNVPEPLFWMAAVVCFLYTTFVVWRTEKDRVTELTTPKLEILIERHPSYIHDDREILARLVRIGVKNISGRSIKNVQADIVAIAPDNTIGEFIPFTLRNTHDNYGPLDPGGVRMVDLIYKGATQRSMTFYPKAPLRPIGTDMMNCVVTVWAHGKNCEARRRFSFSVDGNHFIAVMAIQEEGLTGI